MNRIRAYLPRFIIAIILLSPSLSYSQIMTQLTNNSLSDYIADMSGNGMKIIWTRSGLRIINADGTGSDLVTSMQISTLGASISGDGSKIAFTSNDDHPKREVYVINSDGTGLLRLTNNDQYDDSYAISSDGSKIVAHNEVGIYVINSDGTGFLQLTFDINDRRPSISGDGSVVAYVNQSTSEVYKINSDGTGFLQLTSGFNLAQVPDISDDGTRITFNGDNGINAGIWGVNPNGTGLHFIAASGMRSRLNSDGSILTYEASLNIRRVNFDGTNDISIDSLGGDPVINSTGSRIAYTCTDGDNEICIWDENGVRVSTPAGNSVSVSSGSGLEVTYPSVVSSCTTEFTYNAGGHELPPGKWAGFSNLYYFISANCSFTGPVEVTIDYSESDFFFESGLKLYRWEGSSWADVTTTVDTAANRIIGEASDLGEFVIVEDEPIQVATPAGSNVEADSGAGVKVIYDGVSSACNTSFIITSGGSAPYPGTWAGRSDLRYFIMTDCSYTGDIEVRVNYDEGDFVVEPMLHLARFDTVNSKWSDITGGLDMDGDLIWGAATELGEFAVLEPEPDELETLAGNSVSIDFGDVQVTYPQVAAGCTTFLTLSGKGAALPPERWPGGLLRRYFLSTTCSWTGNIEVTVNFNPADYIDAPGAGLFRSGASGWQEVTSDSGGGWVKGLAPMLGEFAVLEVMPDPVWTPAGWWPVVDFGDATIGYAFDVPEPCQTWRVDWAGGVPLPPWFSDGSADKRYYFSSSCATLGTIEVRINYSEAEFNDESDIGLFYYDGLFWQEITTILDTSGNWVSGNVPSLGREFAVLESLPLQDWVPALQGISDSCGLTGRQAPAGLVPYLIVLLPWLVLRVRMAFKVK